MINDKVGSECSGCLACYNACPAKAIYLKDDRLGFKYPVIDEAKCVECGICDNACPMLCSDKKANTFEQRAYAAINLDEEVRLKSSSGGMFSLIAEAIIKQGGVVLGASFDNEFNVAHRCIDNLNDLDIYLLYSIYQL